MEMHLDILMTLAQKGPLKLTHIMYKANVNCSVLKEYLDFLMQQKLVEEKTLKKERIVYTITEKGLKVLKYFRELQIMMPLFDENNTKIPIIF
jgi:predicted transcriptional regulator